MANTNLSLGLTRGKLNANVLSNVTVGTAAPTAGVDVELRIAAVDANSNPIRRSDVTAALKAFRMALESGSIFSTDIAE